MASRIVPLFVGVELKPFRVTCGWPSVKGLGTRGSTSWHPVAQWLLEGFDLDKQETRDYAMSGVSDWTVLEKGK